MASWLCVDPGFRRLSPEAQALYHQVVSLSFLQRNGGDLGEADVQMVATGIAWQKPVHTLLQELVEANFLAQRVDGGVTRYRIVDFEKRYPQWTREKIKAREQADELKKAREEIRNDPALRARIRGRDDDTCAYCLRPVRFEGDPPRKGRPPKDLRQGCFDHFDPEKRSLNAPENLRISCRLCNQKKWRLSPTEWEVAMAKDPDIQEGRRRADRLPLGGIGSCPVRSGRVEPGPDAPGLGVGVGAGAGDSTPVSHEGRGYPESFDVIPEPEIPEPGAQG